jgi:hypothetical protein
MKEGSPREPGTISARTWARSVRRQVVDDFVEALGVDVHVKDGGAELTE